ncbi:MAG: hypothetical protein AABX52_01080 [Nanoarchaeota archaeon]
MKQSRNKKQQHVLVNHIVLTFLVVVVVLFVYIQYEIYQANTVTRFSPDQQTVSPVRFKKMMSFTQFDANRAHEFMDKDNDGQCDACGMKISDCIASGMMQCTMDPNAQIGILGSAHTHADWKVYINGESIDFTPWASRHEDQMHGKSINDTSAFIHMHPANSPEKAGDVLHMHATGVSLGLFFESIGMNLSKNCVQIDKKYCTNSTHKLGFFVNGKQNTQYDQYVFSDGDKILISYGQSDHLIQELASITDFGQTHKK